MPKRATLAIGGALAALLLLACGDDRLPPEEYYPRVQAIADDVNNTVGAGAEELAGAGADSAASEASLVEAVRDFFVTLTAALDDAVVDLSDLSGSEPADAEDAHNAFVAQASELAAAFNDVSDRLAGAAGFDELSAVLDTLDPSYGLSADFLAACEGLERAAADAGQPIDLECALELIPEDAFAAANPDAAYFGALQAIADEVNEGVFARADAFSAAQQEAAEDADALMEAIGGFFRESALAFDEAAAAIATLAPSAAIAPLHAAFVEELGNMASAFGEIAWRIDGAADLDEVDAILQSTPAALGQPPEFVTACGALEQAAADAGIELILGCG